MFIVANVHMRGVPFISKQAMEEKCLPYWIWNPLLFFFLGLLYSRGNGFGNKAEVTFIAYRDMLCWGNSFIQLQFHFISFSSPFDV